MIHSHPNLSQELNNEHTKQQIRDWLDSAVERAKHPDPREKVQKKRAEKSRVVAGKYGLVA